MPWNLRWFSSTAIEINAYIAGQKQLNACNPYSCAAAQEITERFSITSNDRPDRRMFYSTVKVWIMAYGGDVAYIMYAVWVLRLQNLCD